MDEITGIWRHHKGPHYIVLGMAADSNNDRPREELQVVYVSIERENRSTYPMHVRSESEFRKSFTKVG